jgi:putative ABC transport system permease protein
MADMAGERAGVPRGPGGGNGLPWVRVRLRAAPGAALALFVLVLATAFLAAALPRAVDRYEDDALRHAVMDASPRDRGVDLLSSGDSVSQSTAADPLGPDAIDAVERAFQQLAHPPLRLRPSGAVYGVRSGAEADVTDPEVPRTSDHDPGASLVAQAGMASQVRLLSGRMPRALPAGTPSLTLDAVVTQETAKVLHLTAGQRVHLIKHGTTTPLTVTVCGIVAPRDPSALYWQEDTDLLAPQVSAPLTPPGSEPRTYWHFTLLTDRTAAGSFPLTGSGVSLYWHHPMDPSAMTAHDVPALQKELASFANGPDGVALQRATGIQMTVDGGLGAVLDSFTRDRDAASPLVLIAAVGVATTALAVLLMAGGLAAERRRGEIALLRSRGGSLRGIVRRLAGETAVAALPGGVAGTALALALLPTGRWALPVALGAAVTAVALLALPLRAAWAARRPRPAEREDLAAARPSRRRLVVELTVTALMAGAVVALRQRGTAGGTDPFLAAAPVLVAVAAALVLLRIYPLPLRLLARPAARLAGAVTHLGLARAGRSPATGQLPLLTLLVALTLASFGGSVLAGVNHGRDRAATATVGADARIDARFALGRQLTDQVRKVPGVGRVVTVRVEPNSPDTVLAMPYAVVIVDPAAYAGLTRAIGLPAFPAAALAGDDGRGPLPAVVSPKLAAALGGRTDRIGTGVGTVDIRAAAVLTTTPATPGQQFVIVSAAQLAARHPDMAAFIQYTEPTTLLAMAAPGGRIDGRTLHTVARESTAYVTVLLRSEQRAALNDSPLQHGARTVYLAAVAAGAAYSALALLLSLLQAAPQRATLLARLRTMGMTRRQSRRLVLLETLPQALLAAVGGVLVGLAVIPLLGPGVDLRALAFGTGPRDLAPVDFGLGLRADPWSLALPSAGLLILACAVLLAQVWASGRRRESTELRVGDRV